MITSALGVKYRVTTFKLVLKAPALLLTNILYHRYYTVHYTSLIYTCTTSTTMLKHDTGSSAMGVSYSIKFHT